MGATLTDARRLLRAVDLPVGRTTGTGRVVRQHPGAERSVPVGTPVDLDLRPDDPPPPVEVPPLDGLTVGEAQDLLGPLGLGIEDPPPLDAVITGQDPPAGTEVERTTLVAVDVVPAGAPLGWLAVLAAAALLGGIAVSWGRSRWAAAHPPPASIRPVVDPRPDVRTQVEVPVPRLPPLHVMSRPDIDPTVTTEVVR